LIATIHRLTFIDSIGHLGSLCVTLSNRIVIVEIIRQ